MVADIDPVLHALGGHLRSLADILEGKELDQDLKLGDDILGLSTLVENAQVARKLRSRSGLDDCMRAAHLRRKSSLQQAIDHSRSPTAFVRGNSTRPAPVLQTLGEEISRDSDDQVTELIWQDTSLGAFGASGDTNIVEILSGYSWIFAVAFFLGGFSIFQNPRVQQCYNCVFIGSFGLCFAACLANLVWRTPPFYDFGMDIVTVMFHIVGLHTWFFWRSFTGNGELGNFMRGFLDAELENSPSLQQLGFDCRMMALAIFIYQLMLVCLGWYCFVEPAWDFGLSHSQVVGDDEVGHWHDSRSFASLHAALMWFAVPSHVPTMVAGHAFFVFINRLHALDVWRALELINSAKHKSEDKAMHLLVLATDLADLAQVSLDGCCAHCARWWLVLMVFTLSQLLAVTMHITHSAEDAFFVDLTTRPPLWHMAYDLWHGSLGLLALISLLVFPSHVTFTYQLVPRKFLIALRSAGSTFSESGNAAMYLKVRIRGFTVTDLPVTVAWVTKFASAIAFGLPLYVGLVSQAPAQDISSLDAQH